MATAAIADAVSDATITRPLLIGCRSRGGLSDSPLDKPWKSRQVAGMDRNNLPGLTPVGLLVLATILAVFVPMAVPFVFGCDTVKASDWLGFAGSIITAGVAAIAIWYAWRGIGLQTEIDIISREEERMEALLPGLESALNFLTRVQADLKTVATMDDYRTALDRSRLWLNQDQLRAEIDKRLPTTDTSTRLQIAQTINSILLYFNRAASRALDDLLNIDAAIITNPTQDKISDAKRSVETAAQSVKLARQDFERLVSITWQRISLFRDRMPKFRARIEASFGKD